jgi:hypothetical protein
MLQKQVDEIMAKIGYRPLKYSDSLPWKRTTKEALWVQGYDNVNILTITLFGVISGIATYLALLAYYGTSTAYNVISFLVGISVCLFLGNIIGRNYVTERTYKQIKALKS